MLHARDAIGYLREADARRWPGCRDMCQQEANSSVTAALVIAAVVGWSRQGSAGIGRLSARDFVVCQGLEGKRFHGPRDK